MRKYTLLALAVALLFAMGMMAQTSSGSQSDQSGNPGTQQGNPTNAQPGMGSAPQTQTGGYGGEPATGAQSSQTGTYTPNQGSSSGNAKTIDGCVVRTATDYYIYPVSGQPEHISSAGQDVSGHVGHHVKLQGTEQPSTSASTSGTSGGTSGTAGNTSASNSAESNTGTGSSMSGNTSAAGSSSAAGGQDFVVARVSMVATNCPASITSKAKAAGMSTAPQK